MKKLLLIVFILLQHYGFCQSLTEINEINNNPGRFNNESITIEGIVTQYSQGSAQTTAYYMLKGDFGGEIKVNTNSQKPETHKKYRVSGTIVIDQLNREAYLIEQQRTSISTDTATGSIATVEPPEDNTTLILIIGGVLLLVVLLGFYLMQKKKNEALAYPSGGFAPPSPETSFAPSGGGGGSETVRINTNNDNDFQTIKISTDAAPKTMKLLPGFLEITAGADTGKKFSISGYPTPDGSIISIGRDAVSGDRKYAHIQLQERTVSRKQAEIISVGSKLEVKNLSSTNLTQLNGIEIQPGQKMKLEPNSVIKTGEVEFAYRIN